ncbi:hypothetical protein QUA43_22445 [Microcoleus sp. N9_B4]
MTQVTSCLKRYQSSSEWHSPPRIYILLAIVKTEIGAASPSHWYTTGGLALPNTIS